MSNQLQKFIKLLDEMFQFDQADLDFGIYRIMNQKREDITVFLNEDLVPEVKKAFLRYKKADIETTKQEIIQLEKQLEDMGVPKVSSEKYKTLKEKLNQGVDITALENEVYSDLTNFFKRYYHEGDFLSLRRYKKDVYAIPYEGEELKLHWANADQYYVKSSEYFRDYTFILPSGKTVHFKLVEAGTEQDNNKSKEGKERSFILMNEEPIIEINEELIIRFEYKPDEQKRKREKINEETIEHILSVKGFDIWLQELKKLSPTEKNKNRTIFEKHLNDYTARNTFDYFIHKDLGGFLRRELDFYIKNEIMHLDDIDTDNELRFEHYLSKVKVIKIIGSKIVKFLEQIENFQKKLWLKKKFVVETNYCVTLDRIPEVLYGEIINNKEQIEEWKQLFVINEIKKGVNIEGYSERLTIKFLKQNKYLVIDTKHFDNSFTSILLKNIESIDENTNGVLINSDNFQALNLLKEKYNNEVDCIYIDPPYNAKSTEILYKNTFKHSSWLSMMENRISLSKQFLSKRGLIKIAIDDYEWKGLSLLCENTFGEDNFIANICVVHNPRGRNDDKFFGTSHEYMIVYANNSDYAEIGLFELSDEDRAIYNKVDEISKYSLVSYMRTGNNSNRIDRPNLFYSIYYKPETNELSLDKKEGFQELLPINSAGEEKTWRWNKATFLKKYQTELLVKKSNDQYRIYKKRRMEGAGKKPKTVWTDSRYDASSHGIMLLKSIFGRGDHFSYPKSLNLVYDALYISTKNDSLVLDYFAGSATTGHAVIKLNREDNGNRKYILVEMGEYFDTVTVPRIKKVIYSKDWKDGKPVSREGSSHMIKYIRLESYEDAINNIELKRTTEQELALEEHMSSEAKEDYYLSYMMDVESEGSTSLLSIEEFRNPFDYKMKITNGSEARLQKVDVFETFNYLLGLQVNNMDRIRNFQVITGQQGSGEKILVIWRNLNESTNEDLEDFFVKQGYNSLDSEFDRIYVNGDNQLENLKLKENKWKVVLIEEEFKRLMFDLQDM